MTFGHAECSEIEYNGVYNDFKDNAKVINGLLKQKKYLVGDSLTIADLYLILSQIEMQQCIMDTNFKNSLQFFNGLFKTITQECPSFQKRVGNIRQGKKQIMPVFIGAAPENTDAKAADQAKKNAKKAKANKK